VSMPRRRLALGLALAATLLTGCGTTSSSPGVAVQVGDDRITMNEVDELTGEYCRAIEGQLEGNSQTVPLRYFRGGVAGNLAMRSVAEQLAEEHGVEPGKVYDEKVAQLQQSVGVLDEEVRESVILVESSSAYVEAVQAAVGEKVLTEEGATDPKYSQQVRKGREVFDEWVAEHDVEFDPQLGVQFSEGQVASVDTSLSYPAGEDAQAGGAEQPDPAYARSLPDAHRCG
jgi:hypothetical protein